MTLTQITEKGIKDGEIVNADINASAAIAKSKLASLDIVNADINASAAIAGTKVAPDFGNQNIATTGNITASGTIHSTLLSSSQTGTGGILKLARTGTANGEYQFRMSNDSGTDCNLRIYDVKASATRFTISSDGEIGIGTTSPSTPLHVSTNTNGTSDLLTLHADADGTNNGIASIKFTGNTGNHAAFIKGGHTTNGDSILTFHTDAHASGINPEERMRINSSGNVGIGTTSPIAKLNVNSGSTDLAAQLVSSDANVFLAFKDGDASGNQQVQIGGDENDLVAYAGGSERMRIDSSGRVGIGTSSPDTLLHLRGADTAIIRLENSDDSLGANQIIGGLEFEKTDPNGAGAGVVGGVRMYSQGVVGENTYLSFATASSSTNDVEHMRLEDDGDLRLSSHNAATNFGWIDGWTDSTKGNFIIDADKSQTGQSSSTDGSALVFRTRGGERARIQHAGGISFNGDTAQDNALDDYEEGTFTPMLAGSSNSSTYNVSGTGTYIKIGRKVTVLIRFENQNLDNNAAGQVKIYNMPFTAGLAPTYGSAGSTTDVGYYNVPYGGTNLPSWYIGNNSTAWQGLTSQNNTGWVVTDVSNFHAANLFINFMGTYFSS